MFAGQAGTILVVEDEADLRLLLQYNLEKEGFTVVLAEDGEEALLSLKERPVDLVLLDLMLPNLSGLEVCRQMRRDRDWRTVPIIMLTAKGQESDRLFGLNAGADDYMVKPFSIKELVARVRAVLRRTAPAKLEQVLTYGDILMDLTSYRVQRNGEAVHLSPIEFKILRHFLQNPGKVFSREQLLNHVWGPNVAVELRTVDVHIRRMRKALTQTLPLDPIRTVRSAGYALDFQAEA